MGRQNRQARHDCNRSCRLLICVAAAFLGMVSPVTAKDIPHGSTFFDDFRFFNKARWGISDGWVNGAWQNCLWSKSATSVQDGQLELRFSKQKSDKRNYACGEIQSRHTYGHGTFEARFRTDTGAGLNAAFFTYIGPTHGKPHDEIDVEILTRDTSRVSLNTYVSGKPANGHPVPLPQPSDAGFVTYSFTWSATGIAWYVDGIRVHQTAPGSPLPVNRQKIYASFWGSDTFTNWMGEFTDPGRDLTMQVDWIAFTAEGDGCQFDASVLCALD